MIKPIAHTRNDRNEWHYLEDHLVEVAKKARKNVACFEVQAPAFWIGLWHDLGKANPAFQEYLNAADQNISIKSVPHAFAGAALLYALIWQQQQNDNWKDLAMAIAGHHAGLHDAGALALKLDAYISKHSDLLKQMADFAKHLPTPPEWRPPKFSCGERELFIRMTFSALVDADYLDTQAHFEPGLAAARQGYPTMKELWSRFERNQKALLEDTDARSDVNPTLRGVRREVYEACLAAGKRNPGFFRLTVPTGGGKTRSGLAFALQHVLCNRPRMRRIIVAIPYTSIIEQTAREYRRILGNDAVLEHHSQVLIPENESQRPEEVRLRLASENWDAPVIVSTNVQLFESLFSNRPGNVRKLHNIAGSVIILDEAQTLPVGVLEPVLDVLQSLVKHYGVSVVLSSATQPAFHSISVTAPTYIVPKPRFETHFRGLARVHYTRRTKKISWAQLAAVLRDHERAQIMVVLNSRKDALKLLDELQETDDVFHLSTLLCGWHRKSILRLLKRRLRLGLPVRLVSTQVVEAGVDIDFPEVWRALGPLDRIVQAAGRCNREGKMTEKGRVVIFEPVDGRMPKGEYTSGFGLADFLLTQNDPEKMHDPALHEDYFKRLYAERCLDARRVQSHRKALNFPETAKRFRLMEDTVPVVVEYGQGKRRLADWKNRPSRSTWRRLQPYVLSLTRREADRLLEDGWLDSVSKGLYRWRGKYDRIKGLAEAIYDPADLTV